ncbi:hypothetical protein AUJ46_04390 [Candidatus Peregrinibacteria bacterium CG1_02_54_53]|nr:MAG: hypothetical protein AUJ46_04390 [Candidatus Peregrinibacteria bacterium CG1_02_54_53]
MSDLLPQPPAPRQLEDILHTIMRWYPEFAQGVVSTNSMGKNLIVLVGHGCTTRMRDLLSGFGQVEIREVASDQKHFEFMDE